MPEPPKLRMKTPEELAEARRQSAAQQQVRKATHAVCDALHTDRMKYILERVAEEDATFIDRTVDPIELHAFASNWNCDCGVSPLLQIVQHKACDSGTAQWLYWENDPYYYLRFRSVDDADNDEERLILAMLRAIEDRMTSKDFVTSKIPFDPQPWIETRYANATWAVHTIPASMYHSIVLPEKLT